MTLRNLRRSPLFSAKAARQNWSESGGIGGFCLNRVLRAWRFHRCHCLFKSACSLIDLRSKTCMNGKGKGYCGQFRKFIKDFETALVERFGPVHRVDGADCIIILKSEFKRDLERLILGQKYLGYYQSLDGQPAVFVVLKHQRRASDF